MSTTIDRVKKLFVDKLELKEEQLTPEATLESLGIDSLEKIEFIFAIEDEFKIRVPERDIVINTVQDVISLIERLVSEQGKQNA